MNEIRKITTREGHTIHAWGVFSSLESAREAALASTRVGHLPAIVQVGSRYWHVSGRDASRLERDGYQVQSILG